MTDETPPDSKKPKRALGGPVFTHTVAALTPILAAVLASAATNWPALRTFLQAICPK